jgi:acyl-CoA thioesterase FadM
MNLWFRFFLYLLSLRRRPKLGALETSVLHFHVMPNDLDVNLHVNNGRYLTLMDLGRLDLIVCNGMSREVLRRGWRPVLGAAYINYRRELNLFKRFRLETRILGWEGRWFYIGQQFFRGDELVADAVVKALFVDKNGSLESPTVMEVAGFSGPSPELDPKLLARFAR